MSNGSGRFAYSGHAMGASARFDRLDPLSGLNHVIPTLGSSVLAATGGHAKSHVDAYRYEVTEPAPRLLLAVDGIDTWAEGREEAGNYVTEVSVEIHGLNILDKLQIDLLQLHMLSTSAGTADPVVTTKGNRIQGMRLGNAKIGTVQVAVTFDDQPLCKSGTAAGLAGFLGQAAPAPNAYAACTIARDIVFTGSLPYLTADGNVITWKGPDGMGKIIFGELLAKGHERRLTLVRLDMGSDASGQGSAGSAASNGDVVTG